jgi:hypothetical protein
MLRGPEQIPRETQKDSERTERIKDNIAGLEAEMENLKNVFDTNTLQGRKGYEKRKEEIERQIFELQRALLKDGEQTFSGNAKKETAASNKFEAKIKKVLYYGSGATREKDEALFQRDLGNQGHNKKIVVKSGSTNQEKNELAQNFKEELDKGGAGFEEFSKNDAESLHSANEANEAENKLSPLLEDDKKTKE